VREDGAKVYRTRANNGRLLEMGGSNSESLNDEGQERNRLEAVWKGKKTCVGVLPHESKA
jgi:hypothetical protein